MSVKRHSCPARQAVVLVLAAGLLAAGCSSRSKAPSAGSTGAATTPQPVIASGSLEDQYVSVVKAVGPSVVLIETDQGLGSGVILDNAGNIVTNYHVVASASSFRVTLANGKRYEAELVGTFPPDDLAVVRIDATELQPATFGDSSTLEVGDIVLAIGNPLGLQSSVTDGIVSALGRTVTESTGAAIPDAIQTSAPINPGNSGGALVNLAGEVVGIPTLAAYDPQLGEAAAGIGFAISSNIVADIARQLIEHGKVVESHRAYLGIQVAETTIAGVLVAGLEAGGPAAEAGLEQGDLITAIDGEPTPTAAELTRVLATKQPGQIAEVDVTHPDGTAATVSVTLGEYPG
jgi:S1-C subfamily serine protease